MAPFGRPPGDGCHPPAHVGARRHITICYRSPLSLRRRPARRGDGATLRAGGNWHFFVVSAHRRMDL